MDHDIHNIFFKEYSIELGDTVFSLGAGVGEEIEYMSNRVGKNGKVFAIEADPYIFKKLKNNVSKYNNVTALNIAITDFIGSVNIVDTGGISNYIQKEKTHNSTEVECTTMDHFVISNNIDNIDYIKVNIEGSEVEFLNGFKEKYSIVKKWCISCHDFTGIENQKTFSFVTNFLTERGITYKNYDSPFEYIKYYIYA